MKRACSQLYYTLASGKSPSGSSDVARVLSLSNAPEFLGPRRGEAPETAGALASRIHPLFRLARVPNLRFSTLHRRPSKLLGCALGVLCFSVCHLSRAADPEGARGLLADV